MRFENRLSKKIQELPFFEMLISKEKIVYSFFKLLKNCFISIKKFFLVFLFINNQLFN